MTSSFGQLKQAQNRFADCIESCKAVDASNKDKTILVPLTSSLYVPGKLANVEKVIVDIGTGYYVEKVREELQRTIHFFSICQGYKCLSCDADYTVVPTRVIFMFL